MEGRFLQAGDVAGLREQAVRAEADGVGAIFVADGPLGDPIVLAAGLGAAVPQVLLGARLQLGEDGRHPATLAREFTSLDLVLGGRSVLCLLPPFTPADRLIEAVRLCRALWGEGDVTRDGPHFRVRAAVNRARPASADSPLVALDLTESDEVPPALVGLADVLLRPDRDHGACRLEYT